MRILKPILLILLSLSLSLLACASQDIEEKYLSRDSELYEEYRRAASLLDDWRGQRAKLQQAQQILQNILDEDPGFAPAYREYGRYMIMSGYISRSDHVAGSLESAETVILKAIDIEPEYADAFVLLGHLYTNMEQFDEARMALERADEIGTESPWLHLNWATLIKENGEYQDALDRYQVVVESGTDNSKAMAAAMDGVISMHTRLGNYDAATEGYEKKIEYAPDAAWTWGNYSSFLLFRMGDVDAAIEKGRTALELMNYGMGRYTLGCALFTKWAQLKDDPATMDEAEEYFRQAMQIYPDIDRVISRTVRYDSTKPTGRALIEWQRENNPESVWSRASQ